MREIVFDTETTGLNPLGGDRIVEIGCVELFNRLPTGETFHVYLNPERDMPEAAFRVHGLSVEFLSDKPLFTDIAQDFIDFIGDAALVAHNASFDMGFINAELVRVNRPIIDSERVIDTLQIARRKNPFGPNSLDALCQRYNIDNSKRTKHGALLDSEILAEVYIELTGGRQADLGLATTESKPSERQKLDEGTSLRTKRPTALPNRLSEDELAAHGAFVATLSGDVIWKDYIREASDD
ncbi:MAG: DNA polymerase III subunit epsilon [Alphaproteobacteria bacterium]|nr:DNA polymerase III subunit epsilon [Beijerinckiaceae bacterium]NBQ38830.1 DNA polymerase III subunit epsilon [Alphaproteobacteria bacterium]